MKPTVTQILSLLNKPALLIWSNNLGLEGIKINDYRKKILQKGSSIHNDISNHIKYNIPFSDNKIYEKYNAFIADKKILFCEKSIETDYFTGRLDIVFEFNDLIYLCDWKRKSKKLYLENKLQLAAYRMAFECDRLAIISVPDFKIIDFDMVDFELYKETLIYLSKLYINIKRIENGETT